LNTCFSVSTAFGITSDPLTHFAVVFSALIHDVDHVGVSNGQLATENPSLAGKYNGQSLAEQNSVDIAWGLLMLPAYEDLRKCLFVSSTEFLRFRHLVVNTVLATDIFDPQLKALRNMRWDKAFNADASDSTSDSLGDAVDNTTTAHGELESDSTNRKATIVIEHVSLLLLVLLRCTFEASIIFTVIFF
jgi:hypothetical protein